MSVLEKYRYDKKEEIHLHSIRTDARKEDISRKDAEKATEKNQEKIQQLQEKLYADAKEGLIILLQARDAAGKDSTIKHVMSGVNPQGVDVYSFKTPSHEELAHDFLWRFTRAVPLRGKIAIFNRSYYEDVLIVKVRELYKNYSVPERMKTDDLFDQRYQQIRHFEKYLYQNGYRIIKIFLNVSAQKQKERFLERLSQPEKNWKFSSGDLAERGLWNEYTDAYEKAIENTASKDCPWYIVPADQKWYARYLVSEIIASTLEDMDPHFPVLDEEETNKLEEYRQALENEKTTEGPDGFAASEKEEQAAKKQVAEHR